MLDPTIFIVIALLTMIVSCAPVLCGGTVSTPNPTMTIFGIIIINALLAFALWWGLSHLWLWVVDTPLFWLFVVFILPWLLLVYFGIRLLSAMLDYFKV